MEQEGIEADAEVLSVLAQAGEGSVRDSLSALDQAIACCGTKLDASGGARAARACSRSNRWDRLRRRCIAADSRRMLEVVAELEANGRSLQHFLTRTGSLFPQSAGGENSGVEHQAGRGVA